MQGCIEWQIDVEVGKHAQRKPPTEISCCSILSKAQLMLDEKVSHKSKLPKYHKAPVAFQQLWARYLRFSDLCGLAHFLGLQKVRF